MITLITAVLGIAGTLCAWYFNPKQATYRELDSIYKQLEDLYAKRDKALAANNSNDLTVAIDDISKLFARKAVLLRRF